ncbi:TonB-dependent receptor plug domain-containing protein [Bermanella marisrubri]|uniref:Outer membrane receptor for ferrienterochelin and colicins n=1 Tax=Bermanella marisrubri TaxID=207949 RepID=Q1N1P7_9GAMM|nr:TonB-dependent receptor plug domain-containing protein [Bermanella marisrubri]EAT12234.1 Outer membrane receptor for ferrienterochelin and colicins [Oceanobacter sp. RED65] [Bermanella marisrubri]QIZ83702.1 TonB-dependent receptor plug domain-containing protein [Bermanella marisrubri]
MQIKIDVASNIPKTVNKQPSTVTLITRDMIERSNAVYLMDLLQNVPGFWAGADTIGTFSLSFRGIWGMEAKILLIVDGIEQNELSFGSLPLGNRFPVSTIEQIEIIRGPGSVKYGGQAALAVIKVSSISQKTETALSSHAEVIKQGLVENSISLYHGGTLSDETSSSAKYDMTLSAGYGDYSVARWQGLDGYEQDLKNYSNSQPLHAWLKLQEGQQYIQVQYDRFEQEDRLLFGDAGLFYSPNERYQEANTLSFEHLALQAYSRSPISSVWDSESKLTLVNQKPWNSDNQYGQTVSRDATRYRLDQTFYWHGKRDQDIAFGLFYYQEYEKVTRSFLFDSTTRFDNDNSIEQINVGGYFQHSLYLPFANVTYGARYEDHDAIGKEWVPRLAINSNWDSTYLKFVYNQAFKTPQFDTLASAKNSGSAITKTEKTLSTELELGYRISSAGRLSYNVFWLEIQDFIGFNPSSASNVTLGDISNFGHELMFHWKTDVITMNASYSLFLVDQNSIEAIGIANEKNALLGIPNHMLKFDASLPIQTNASIYSKLNIISSRYACTTDINLICGEPEKLSEEYDWEISYQKRYDKWRYGMGIKNILDEKILYVQPYRGSQSPIQGLPRRLSLDVHYRF